VYKKEEHKKEQPNVPFTPRTNTRFGTLQTYCSIDINQHIQKDVTKMYKNLEKIIV